MGILFLSAQTANSLFRPSLSELGFQGGEFADVTFGQAVTTGVSHDCNGNENVTKQMFIEQNSGCARALWISAKQQREKTKLCVVCKT